MNRLHQLLQHHTNPLHLYCRLRDAGISQARAMGWCIRLERMVIYMRKWISPAM